MPRLPRKAPPSSASVCSSEPLASRSTPKSALPCRHRQAVGRHGPYRRAFERRNRRHRHGASNERLVVLRLRCAPRRLRKRTGRKPGPETLEPVILGIYEMSKAHHAGPLHGSPRGAQHGAPQLAKIYTKCDVLLSPTTARVSEPWGKYHLSPQWRRRQEHDREDLRASPSVHAPTQSHGHARHVVAAGHAFDRRSHRCADRRPPRRGTTTSSSSTSVCR